MATRPIIRYLSDVIDQARATVARQRYGRPRSLDLTVLSSYEEYLGYRERNRARYARRNAFEASLPNGREAFSVPGFCYPCGRPTQFAVDYQYCGEQGGSRIINWRERLVCGCGLNNRLRASIHLFDRCCSPRRDDRIFITEQTTTIYRWLAERYPSLIGSEYMGDRVPFGAETGDGIRNESLTHLTFPDQSFEHIITFDVLEHIPDVEKALCECRRCLKPGGTLLISVPFVAGSEHTLVRAKVDARVFNLALFPHFSVPRPCDESEPLVASQDVDLKFKDSIAVPNRNCVSGTRARPIRLNTLGRCRRYGRALVSSRISWRPSEPGGVPVLLPFRLGPPGDVAGSRIRTGEGCDVLVA